MWSVITRRDKGSCSGVQRKHLGFSPTEGWVAYLGLPEMCARLCVYVHAEVTVQLPTSKPGSYRFFENCFNCCQLSSPLSTVKGSTVKTTLAPVCIYFAATQKETSVVRDASWKKN